MQSVEPKLDNVAIGVRDNEEFLNNIELYKTLIANNTLDARCASIGGDTTSENALSTRCQLDFRSCQSAHITEENLNTNMINSSELTAVCRCREGIVKCLALLVCDADNYRGVNLVCDSIKDACNTISCASVGVVCPVGGGCTWDVSTMPNAADIVAAAGVESESCSPGGTFSNCPWNVPFVSNNGVTAIDRTMIHIFVLSLLVFTFK